MQSHPQHSFADLLKSIPAFLGIPLEEEPRYELVTTLEGEVEIRRYEPLLVAQISLGGGNEDAVDRGLRRLQRYLEGASVEGAVVESMSEVRQQPYEGGCTVSIALTNDGSVGDVSRPRDRDVRLARIPEQVVASFAYRGEDSEEARHVARARLLSTLGRHAAYRVVGHVFSVWLGPLDAFAFAKRNEARVELDPAGLPEPATGRAADYATFWLTSGLPW